MHVPVLLNEILEMFSDKKISVFFDGTLGLAGHAEALLKNHPEIERYIACDQDNEAIELAKKKLEPWKEKVEYVHGNFSDVEKYLNDKSIRCIDGCLFDVGMSSFQIQTDERGFSFLREGPLDMRMDQRTSITAEEVVNDYSEKKLGEIFRDLGEEPGWRFAAKAIVEARGKKRIQTTIQLAEILKAAVRGKKHLHPATLIFQALRIFVNDELNVLEKGIHGAITKLCPEGIIGVISFHRLEDRIVKNIFRDASHDSKRRETFPTLNLITKKPIVPTDAEVRSNPRSRSAKLRFAQKRTPGQVKKRMGS